MLTEIDLQCCRSFSASASNQHQAAGRGIGGLSVGIDDEARDGSWEHNVTISNSTMWLAAEVYGCA